MQHKKTNPNISAAPTTDPTTMPAIAPPESPLDPADAELEGEGLDVEVGSVMV
jgi:hypothetical protein